MHKALNPTLVMSNQPTRGKLTRLPVFRSPNTVFAGFAAICLASAAFCQTMPQDKWRYNQHQFSAPSPTTPMRSIAIGVGGVYVGLGEPATAVQQFQLTGVPIRQFGTFGQIVGIACDSAGNVYVLDAGNSTIQSFDKDGTFIRQWGGPGTGDGQFSLRSDLATTMSVGPNDQIYVCDPGNTRVQIFDVQGNFLRKWGQPGELPSQFRANQPTGIAVCPMGVFVTVDHTMFGTGGGYPNKRLFTPDGQYLRGGTFATGNSAGTDHDPNTLATTPDGLTIVSAGVGANWGGTIVVDQYFSIIFASTQGSGYPDIPGWGCVAASLNGNIYQIVGTKVVIYEREYSSVQNPPTPPAIPEPIVLGTAQRTNTGWLDVDYKVAHAGGSNVTVAALAFINAGNTLSCAVPMTTFMENTATNLGPNVPSNAKRRFTWNMGADWSIDYAQIQVEVLAKDTRNLIGFHWITVPSDGTNPALQVSSAPVPESELLSIWFWFVATHNPGVAFANGNVTGVGGAYDGQLLANDSGTTSAGRFFAYTQMGVRAITLGEISRVNSGNYGFSSVDANSVVKVTGP